MIYIISGSAKPDVGRFRDGLQVARSCYPGEPLAVPWNDLPNGDWLCGHPREHFDSFDAALKASSRDDIVLCANGGTGAARVTYYYKDRVAADGDVRSPVMGFSDAFVYPLMAWLWGYTNCFYGPNVVDFSNHVVLSKVRKRDVKLEPVLFDRADIVNGWDDQCAGQYQVVPVCSGTLCQVSRAVQLTIMRHLRNTPSILMLDDNYPDNEMGALALYEDLTMLYDIVEALADGGGVLTVGSVYGAWAVLMDYQRWFPGLTTLYGVDFGHSGGRNQIMHFGATARITFDPWGGLEVSVE